MHLLPGVSQQLAGCKSHHRKMKNFFSTAFLCMSEPSCSVVVWIQKHSQASGAVRLRNCFNVINYVQMQLDPGLFIAPARYDKIKLNYPHRDDG